MKKKIYIALVGICLAMLFSGCQRVANEVPPKQAEIESADYWIAKMEQPDAAIMDQNDIAEYNREIKQEKREDWPEGCTDVSNFPKEVDGAWLKDRMDYLNLKNTKYYFQGAAITAEQWETYYAAMNREQLPGVVASQYGIIVHNASVHDLPTEDILTNSGMNEAENRIQQTMLKINEPVVVLWESVDKEWYYAVSNEYTGWIKNTNCALVTDREEWLKFQEQEKFLMVCDDGIAEIEEPVLMGTKLFLAENSAMEELENYVVRMPDREENGYVTYCEIAISSENKVSVGYLKYTGRNIVELAFSRLGDPYGWENIDGKRDCSSYIKDIYRCFGFELPRNSREQMALPCMAVSTENMSEERKQEILDQTIPGAILGINGHVMLYLGSANNQYYVISMLGSYIPETVTEDFGNHIVSANKVMVNSLDVKRRNGNNWLQELLSIVSLELKK